jgi:cell fate (sporulation/competence/biofilm development) regulator YlbF (YheA/YmcA/DUF963 family)
VIDEKAHDLGRLLGQTEEYKALRRATERLQEDTELQKQLGEMDRVAQQIQVAGRSGQEPPAALIEQYEKLFSTVQTHAVYQQLAVAQENFEKLMGKINEKIYEGIRKGSASPIIQLG